MQARRESGFDEPAEPAQDASGDRPLIPVAVVHQHNDAAAEGQPRQEGQTVLAVDHHVGTDAAQWAQPQPRRHHGQSGPDVDRVAPAAATDLDPVDDLPAGRTRVSGGPQGDGDSRLRQQRPDALQVRLRATALRVAGVAPAQQKH